MDFKHIKGLLTGLGATMIWGSFYPVSRFLFGNLGGEFDEISFTFIRMTAAMFAMLPLLFFSPRRHIFAENWKTDWLPLFVWGAIGIVLEGFLVFIANKYTTAARTSLMANTSPIMTVLIAWIFIHEKLTGRKIAGMLLGFAGVVLTMCSQGQDVFTDSGSGCKGEFLALASGFCWSVYTVAGAKICSRYGGMYSTALMLVFSLPAAAGLVVANGSSFIVDWSWQIWCAAIYLGVVGTSLANGLWYSALKYLKPGELGAFGYISAMTAATASALALKEKFSFTFICSIILVLTGVGMMMVPQVKKKES